MRWLPALALLGCAAKHVREPKPPMRPEQALHALRTLDVPKLPQAALLSETVKRLREIGQHHLDRLGGPDPTDISVASDEGNITAFGACARPGTAEREAMEARALAWIDKVTPDEVADPDAGELEMQFGCAEQAGTIAFITIDRRTRASTADGADVGHWWIVRIAPDRIDAIDHLRGRARAKFDDAGAIQATLDVLALADLDGDGRLDVVAKRERRVNGDPASQVEIGVHLAKAGKPGAYAAIGERESIVLAPNQPRDPRGPVITVELGRGKSVASYHCVTVAGHVACPEAERVKQREAELGAATALATIEQTPDRDDLEHRLAMLGMKPAEQAPLLALVPATAPELRVHRAIERLVVAKRPNEAAVAAEASEVAAAIRADFGDAPCPVAKVGAEEKAARAWLAKRGKTLASEVTVVCTAARGAYVRVRWRWLERDQPRDHDAMLFVGGDATEVLAEEDQDGDAAAPMAKLTEIDAHRHGPQTIVTIVAHAQLTVTVDGAIATRFPARRGESGAFDLYRGSELIAEHLPAATAYWHAGARGPEKQFVLNAISVFLPDGTTPVEKRVVELERRSVAWEVLAGFEDNKVHDYKYRAAIVKALEVVGGDADLRAEVEKLR